MEQVNLSEILPVLTSVNSEIAEQNHRLVLSREISDDEFKHLAVSGLAKEQQSSFDRRNEAATNIDYGQAMTEWAILLDQKEVARREHEFDLILIQDQIDTIRSQAELTVTIAPSAAQEITALTDQKIAEKSREMAERDAHFKAAEATLTEQELGFVAIFEPWEIPKVPGIKLVSADETPHAENTEQHKNEPEMAPASSLDLPETRNESQSDDLSPEEVEEALKKVLWAVFDYAEKAGDEGVRLEEMRRTVPELQELSDQQYSEFKKNFSKMRDRTVKMLGDMGVKVTWYTTGQTRGTRYHVKTSECSTIPTSRPNRPVEPEQKVAQPTEEIVADPTNDPEEHIETPGNEVVEVDVEPETSIENPELKSEAEAHIVQSPVPAEVTEADSIQEKDSSSEKSEEILLVQYLKKLHTGQYSIEEAPFDEAIKQLGIKRDRQLMREVKKWITWLTESPRAPKATRKIRSFRGVRVEGDMNIVPMYRFSPKDATGLTVPRTYLRQRLAYLIVDNRPVIIDVLDHDSFDRKYN